LSIELDSRIKKTVATFCGKDTYEFGDVSSAEWIVRSSHPSLLPVVKSIYPLTLVHTLPPYYYYYYYYAPQLTREVSTRVQGRLEEFTGKDYEFGDGELVA
jgi:hypothetical protein